MIIKRKKYSLINIQWLLIFKPICDMFYSVSLLNYIIMGYAILILIYLIYKKKKLSKEYVDLIIILLTILFSFSLVRNINSFTVRTYIKIISPFILFFIGRFSGHACNECINSLRTGYFITLIIDIYTLITGLGFVYWGDALTFKGLYYNKTDIGVALLNLIILQIIKEKHNILDLLIIVFSSVMIILSNSRMSLILLFAELVFTIIYIYETKTGKKLYINTKIICFGVCVGASALYLIRFLGTTQFFVKRGFISFNFNSFSDLFSGANTQGRFKIWTQVISAFNCSSLSSHVFGIDLQSTIASIQNATKVATHSLYIGYLYSVGFLGVITLIILTFFMIKRMNRCKNRTLFYFLLLSLSIFLVNGISVNTHEYTDYTWNLFLFTGLLYTQANFKSCQKTN